MNDTTHHFLAIDCVIAGFTDTVKPSRQVSLLDREMELFSMYNLKTTQP